MKKNKKKKFKQVSPSKQIEKNLGRVKAFYDQNGYITRQLNVSQCKTAECICTINNGEFCVPPDRQMQSRYTWSAEHRIVACVIQKSMSTVMSAIMCFLHNKTAFRLKNREFATECYPVRFCAYINEAQTMERMLIKLNKSEEGFQEETVDQWRYLAVIRNPMDRFLSAYVDKCIGQPRQNWSCHECKSNLTCFMERQYEWQMYNAYRNNVTVRGFFEDRHFAPQNCNPEDVLKFLEKLSIILREQGVDQKSIRFIQDQVTRKRTDHSTIESPARKFYEKYLRTNPYLMELLVKMYYHDYVQFGFKLPDLFGYKD